MEVAVRNRSGDIFARREVEDAQEALALMLAWLEADPPCITFQWGAADTATPAEITWGVPR
jgi:hypothetical protein